MNNIRVPVADFQSFAGRAQHLYTIRNKNGENQKYVFNEAQDILNEIIEEEFQRSYERTGCYQCKIIVLKSRQVGVTTDTALRIGDMMLMRSIYGLVLAHTGEDTDLIYDKYQIFYDNLPDTIELLDGEGNVISQDGESKIPFKPKEESYSAKQLRFANQTKSWLTVRTAGSGDNIGKGSTMPVLHLTEAGNYFHYSKVLSSAMQMVPKKASHFVVIESTANGTSGAGEGYYKEWVKAERAWKRFKNGETDSFEGFRPVFIPWWKLSEYTKPLQGGKFVDIEDIDFGGPDGRRKFLEREQLLMDDYGVSKEHINWYRANIKENCQHKLSEANRYYPTFAEDAFLATDKCFFDSNKLHQLKVGYDSGETTDTAEIGYIDDNLLFIPSVTGEAKMWEMPDPQWMNRYILSVDSSTGLEEGDYTSMYVFDRLTQKFVFHWHGKLAEDLVAMEAMKIGMFYNQALIIPEANLATVVNIIKPDGVMPYDGDIYYRNIRADGTLDYGFLTSGGTRKPMLDTYNAWLRTNYDKLPDLETIEEHLAFVRNLRGSQVRYEADAGKKDDRVISAALCITAFEWYDEEMAELNKDFNDITSVVRVNTRRDKLASPARGFRQSSIRGK